MKSRILSGIILIFLLSACSPTLLTGKEQLELTKLRQVMKEKPNEQGQALLMYNLINSNPRTLAQQAASEGDFSAISLAMGYEATSEDAEIFGLECNSSLPTTPVVFGCIPPPMLFFKLVYEYNTALTEQPNFPYECVKSKEDLTLLKKYEVR